MHQELVATHPVMKGVWRTAWSLAKKKGAVMAPLLVDDRLPPEGPALTCQEPEALVRATLGLEYEDLPWFAKRISEAELQGKHGDIGCARLDAVYHTEVMSMLGFADRHWKRWIVVHPVDFRKQQSDMLELLWDSVIDGIEFGTLAGKLGENKERLRAKAREAFLRRFVHHWVNDEGRVSQVTRPVYRSKHVVHEPIHAK